MVAAFALTTAMVILRIMLVAHSQEPYAGCAAYVWLVMVLLWRLWLRPDVGGTHAIRGGSQLRWSMRWFQTSNIKCTKTGRLLVRACEQPNAVESEAAGGHVVVCRCRYAAGLVERAESQALKRQTSSD